MGVGAGLGLLSGLTGTGGGIFLTPLMIFMRWASDEDGRRDFGGVHPAEFDLRAARQLQCDADFPEIRRLAARRRRRLAALIGSYFGSRRFDPAVIKRLLAVVLVIAGTKLIFT